MRANFGVKPNHNKCKIGNVYKNMSEKRVFSAFKFMKSRYLINSNNKLIALLNN